MRKFEKLNVVKLSNSEIEIKKLLAIGFIEVDENGKPIKEDNIKSLEKETIILELSDELKAKDKEIEELMEEIDVLKAKDKEIEDVLDLSEMNLEELTAYAKEHEIDLGQSTSENGIRKKIEKQLK